MHLSLQQSLYRESLTFVVAGALLALTGAYLLLTGNATTPSTSSWSTGRTTVITMPSPADLPNP